MASHSRRSTRGVKPHARGRACLQTAAWRAVLAPLRSAWETPLILQGTVKGKRMAGRSACSEWISLWKEADWPSVLRSSGAWACQYLLAWSRHPHSRTTCIFFKGQSAVGGVVSLLPAFPTCRCQVSGWTRSPQLGCRNRRRPPLGTGRAGGMTAGLLTGVAGCRKPEPPPTENTLGNTVPQVKREWESWSRQLDMSTLLQLTDSWGKALFFF